MAQEQCSQSHFERQGLRGGTRETGSLVGALTAPPWLVPGQGASCKKTVLSAIVPLPVSRSTKSQVLLPPSSQNPSFKRTRKLCQGQDPTPVSDATQAILLPSLAPGNHVSDCLETLRPSFASNDRLCSNEGKGCGGSCF